jgi:hypothetical protein
LLSDAILVSFGETLQSRQSQITEFCAMVNNVLYARIFDGAAMNCPLLKLKEKCKKNILQILADCYTTLRDFMEKFDQKNLTKKNLTDKKILKFFRKIFFQFFFGYYIIFDGAAIN